MVVDVGDAVDVGFGGCNNESALVPLGYDILVLFEFIVEICEMVGSLVFMGGFGDDI